MQNNNPTIGLDMNRIFDLKGESTNEVADIILPVVPIIRILNIVRNANTTASGSLNVYTTPADKDFYLTSCTVAITKDAANDIATGAQNLGVYCTIDGANRYIALFPVITLTAQTYTLFLQFNYPIKVDRNTIIVLYAAAHTAGVIGKSCCIHGYTVETTK